MKRVFLSLMTILAVAAAATYSAGVLTGEERHEESCVLCRAIRYTGRHYGFPYSRVDDSSVSTWYRQNVDPSHGRDDAHPHVWRQSACSVYVRRGFGTMDYSCSAIPTVFFLRPEIQLEALLQIPDRSTQIGLIKALNSANRKANAHRVRLLIEYYYIARHQMTWHTWWKRHANDFGFSASTSPTLANLR